MWKKVKLEFSTGVGEFIDWKVFVGLGFESKNSQGVSTSELLKFEIVLKTVWFESSESVRGELEKKYLGGKNEV